MPGTHELVAFALLAVAGFAAGFVNAIAGAGSLLTLPALLFSGLDASAANATNRIAVLLQSIAAVIGFRHEGLHVDRASLWLLAPSGLGALVGAYAVTLLTEPQMRIAIALCIVVMLVLSFYETQRGEATATERIPPPNLKLGLTFFGLGFYAGFIQAGVGIAILLALALGHRVDLVRGNVIKVLVILAATAIALVVFALRGETLDLARGAVLGAATSIGGYLGARETIKRGQKLVRAMMTIAVLGTVAKLVLDTLRG